ncbi:DUF1850 domain-containing protein [Nesterenkonia massiliensis]|uniref:DUF1850 domain-containing protein n=1 Tax=Nesterenkonia massiliensis TaxID=1232429 RepID=UPI000404EF6F|nr:DUF1850 domain-containing protein [Nesterenkonia massiliensis]
MWNWTEPFGEPSLSRRRLLALSGSAAAAALAPLLLNSCSSGLRLVCEHQRTGEVYAQAPVETGTQVTLSWIHSIELSRWSETYLVQPDRLVLSSTEFFEYGAGMPLDEGDVHLRDGKIVIENINRNFDAIRWFHSHRADYRISINDDPSLIDASELPDREPLTLSMRN